ncbi:MAG TPA: BsuPI-related putative proteinase inhibitor [Gemmatimonadaceae bacterium]|nr:BsuPI-related putative proteinase inhibitor [Gemmatimonadaceae bacterium]
MDTFATRVEARAGVPFAEDGPVVTLEVPLTVVVGAPVPVKIRVKNATAAPLELYLRGRDVTFDLAVTDSSGDAIWRRLEGQATQAVLQLKTLAPGDAVDLSYTWDQKSQRGLQVPPGRYTIRGSLVTDGQSKVESPPATLDIMQR